METNRSPAAKPAALAGAVRIRGRALRGGLSAFAFVTAITHFDTACTVVDGV